MQQILDRLRQLLGASRHAERPASVGLKPYRQRFQRYLQGSGIEIGALHNPMPVDAARAKVRYVDRVPVDGQREHYPELANYTLIEPDIVADADKLPMLADGSEDFVIANHLMEHLPDPIAAMKEWYRVLRPGGILFLGLPDKRLIFDKDRPRTTLAHLIADHRDGGQATHHGHYEEYSRLVHKKTDEDLRRDVADLLARSYSIHFHVWIPEDIKEFLAYLRDDVGLQWKILEHVDSTIDNTGSDEFIFVLQKPDERRGILRGSRFC